MHRGIVAVSGVGSGLPDECVCRDVLFLDLALEAASRGVVESSMGLLKAAAAAAAREVSASSMAPSLLDALSIATLSLESASRTLATNDELALSLLDFQVTAGMISHTAFVPYFLFRAGCCSG